MKIYISNREDLISFSFFERLYRKRHPVNWVFFDKMDWIDKLVDYLQRGCQFIVDKTINSVLERYPLPTEYIKIDKHDLYNLDITLAKVIHASLVEFRKTYGGIPAADLTEDVNTVVEFSKAIGSFEDEVVQEPQVNVNLEDAEYELRRKQWEILMDEMIWAFQQVKTGEWEWSTNYSGGNNVEKIDCHRQRILNGMMLFVKYYCSFWN